MFLGNKILGDWKKVWNNYIFQGKTVVGAYIVCVHKEGQASLEDKRGGQYEKKKSNV